jgi:hypothetical protein
MLLHNGDFQFVKIEQHAALTSCSTELHSAGDALSLKLRLRKLDFVWRSPGPIFMLKIAIVAFISMFIIGNMIYSVNAFEIKPPSKIMSPSEQVEELRTATKRSQDIKRTLLYFVHMGGAAAYWLIKHTADVFFGILITLAGYFLPNIPGLKEQGMGSAAVDIKGKVDLRGTPRFVVMFAGLLIVIASLSASLFGHASLLASRLP